MRYMAVAGVVLLGAGTAAVAQSPDAGGHSGALAVSYEWVRTNTQPGECGCFHLNGGGIAGSWNFDRKWAAVADFSGGYAGNGPSTGNSLTLISYMAGARYRFGQFPERASRRLAPFAQALAGGAHAGGGIAGAGDGANAFASRVGGGVDLSLTPRFGIRLIQADYYFTKFANAGNDHQNNLLLGAGVVLRWQR